MHLSIDIETFSSVDLKSSGVYKYAQSPDFTILLLAYRYGAGPVQVIDLTAEPLPDQLRADILSPAVPKHAFNAAFERTCLAAYLGVSMPPEQWHCTMVKGAYLGLPLSLDTMGAALGIQQQKMTAGKALVKFFCQPCKPTKVNGGRVRNTRLTDPQKWEDFKAYCARDVEAETEIAAKLSFYTIPAEERRLWCVDQHINDRGITVDLQLANNAIRVWDEVKDRLINRAVQLTGLSNPNSAAQLKQWLCSEGIAVDGLTKKDMPGLMQQADNDTVREVLAIRQELAKTSVKKYAAMTAVTCSGGRARGLFQFYGANRTGRWAGRLIQLQNLPRNDMKTLGLARDIVSTGDTDTLELLYSNIPDVLSQLIRTSFVPAPGMQLAVADFSAIEARVIAWLAGEKWRLEVFNTHGKIYEASASQMFKVPIEAVTKGSDYRQRGKVAELALGYGGGPNALISMGALNMGVPEDELPALVAVWRRSNPAICRLWVDLETCAVRAVDTGQPQVYKSLKFYVWKNVLFIKLPSGRELAYPKPTLVESKFGGLQLKYMGVDQYTKKWGWITTYGGKITENVVQAIARDCLSTAILRVHDTGYRIVIHVHDEIVVEVLEDDSKALEELELLMAEPIKWAPGLPLRADGYTAKYYHKKD